MNKACEICKGACCEGIRMPLEWFKSEEVRRWFAYHGKDDGDGWVYLPCPCDKFKDGKCSIYDERPTVCRLFGVGCDACFKAIKRNRPFQFEEIRLAMRD